MRGFFKFICLTLSVFISVAMSACNSHSDTPSEHQNLNPDSMTTIGDGISNNPTDTSATNQEKKIILYFGNSLTAGLGLASKDQAYPALLQSKIDELGLQYEGINAGLSGETSAGGKDRITWYLTQKIPDIFLLELGANDGLRGISPEATYTNLKSIIDQVQTANPNCEIILAGMKVPPSMGQDYFKAFEDVFPRLAKDEGVHLIPFILEDVAGIAQLNQEDGMHPTAEGQKIMAEQVWKVLRPLLNER